MNEEDDGTVLGRLENEVSALKQKLQEQLERDRGSKLEQELRVANEEVVLHTKERYRLQMMVQDLQRRLIDVEASNINSSKYNYSPGSGNDFLLDANDISVMYDGERERQMESMYKNAKKDKEKSIKLLIQLIGKDRIADFLDENSSGSVDILDRLYDGVMSRHIKIDPVQSSSMMKASSSPVNKSRGSVNTEINEEMLQIAPSSSSLDRMSIDNTVSVAKNNSAPTTPIKASSNSVKSNNKAATSNDFQTPIKSPEGSSNSGNKSRTVSNNKKSPRNDSKKDVSSGLKSGTIKKLNVVC